jgi:hypothetical protein
MSPHTKSSTYKQEWKGAVCTGMSLRLSCMSGEPTRNGPSAGQGAEIQFFLNISHQLNNGKRTWDLNRGFVTTECWGEYVEKEGGCNMRLEKTALWEASQFILLAKYYKDRQNKEHEMVGRIAHMGEKYIRNFGRKTWKIEASWTT